MSTVADTGSARIGSRSPGHVPRSSTSAATEAMIVTPPARRGVESGLENVPGYRARGMAGQPVAAQAAAIVPGASAPQDAAAAAFGRIDTLEVVIGDDDRRAVDDATAAPWRQVCALRITAANGARYLGTGWFIGERTVMTAGHCVFLHDAGGWVKEVEVIPGLRGEERPFGSGLATEFHAPDGWTDQRNSDFDYGSIVLDDPALGEAVGSFSFGAMDDDALLQTDGNISGYPADRDRGSVQYYHARRIVRESTRRLYYDIDTFGGQSGAPVWVQTAGRRIGVGVHTSGGSTMNYGTRITADVFHNMVLWKNLPHGG